uniref:SH2 domain-containing protein n=1 Tax=Ascaris lumbricoides TaxID=6252 RepID=A0A0M3HTJ9_ASCLU
MADELKDLETGLTFPLKYLGFVPILESLKKLTDSAERENLTRHCMYLVCNQLGLSGPNPEVSERLLAQFEFQKLGPPTVENKFVDLNVALKAFTIIDGDGVRILEHHPIDVISFASPGREEALRGVLCFVSNVSTEMGRRCVVFMEEDKNIEFIMDTMSKIFHLKNQGREYINVNTLPVARGLEREPWFHGEIDRTRAEALLHNEGDFLVRMSRNTARNFVLSGIANSVPKHFLLLDENDQKVRKQSQVFETIVQLIEHHRARNVPIISEGSELYLVRPILRDTPRI